MRLTIVSFLLLASLTGFGSAADQPTSIRAAYELTKAQVDDDFDESGMLRSTPRNDLPQLLRRQWSLIGNWSATYLNEHPSASAKELTASISDLDPDLGVDVAALPEHAFVISTTKNEIGNVSIVANYGGTYWPPWTIADTSTLDPILASWNERALAPKSEATPTYASKLGVLPSTSDGKARFYVEGAYMQWMGATIGGQLSIWSWDGRTASLLLAKRYWFMIDSQDMTQVIDGRLVLHTKEDFKTFFSCGSCEEKKAVWTVLINPTGVTDLGSKAVDPELDVIDELFYRLEMRASAVNIASPRVVSALAAEIPDRRVEAKKSKSANLFLSAISEATVRRSGAISTVRLALDDYGPYTFTVRRTNGKFFITDVATTQ